MIFLCSGLFGGTFKFQMVELQYRREGKSTQTTYFLYNLFCNNYGCEDNTCKGSGVLLLSSVLDTEKLKISASTLFVAFKSFESLSAAFLNKLHTI